MMSELTLPDEKVTSVFCVGDPANKWLKLVLDRGIDMVVMGIKANDFSHFFYRLCGRKDVSKMPGYGRLLSR